MSYGVHCVLCVMFTSACLLTQKGSLILTSGPSLRPSKVWWIFKCLPIGDLRYCPTGFERAPRSPPAPSVFVRIFRPNITTLEGLLAAATMLPHAEQLELLEELKHMIGST